MRAYFFGNMYLSSIQQGIQAGHVIGEMSVKYMVPNYDPVRLAMYKEWAVNHKTMILLNAGYGENILALDRFFNNDQNMYPYAMFCEEEASLNGAATSIGIIVPEHIYIGAAQLRGRDEYDISTIINEYEVRWFDENNNQMCIPISQWESTLMAEMNKYGLAS